MGLGKSTRVACALADGGNSSRTLRDTRAVTMSRSVPALGSSGSLWSSPPPRLASHVPAAAGVHAPLPSRVRVGRRGHAESGASPGPMGETPRSLRGGWKLTGSPSPGVCRGAPSRGLCAPSVWREPPFPKYRCVFGAGEALLQPPYGSPSLPRPVAGRPWRASLPQSDLPPRLLISSAFAERLGVRDSTVSPG